jgi:hypothetical protein
MVTSSCLPCIDIPSPHVPIPSRNKGMCYSDSELKMNGRQKMVHPLKIKCTANEHKHNLSVYNRIITSQAFQQIHELQQAPLNQTMWTTRKINSRRMCRRHTSAEIARASKPHAVDGQIDERNQSRWGKSGRMSHREYL